jgi:hypothetical protein
MRSQGKPAAVTFSLVIAPSDLRGELSLPESAQLPNTCRMKPQHNILARNASRDQFVRNGSGRSVVLEPHFSAREVNVNDGTMYATNTVPADVHEFEMLAQAVLYDLRIDLTMRWLVTGIFRYHGSDDLAIAI